MQGHGRFQEGRGGETVKQQSIEPHDGACPRLPASSTRVCPGCDRLHVVLRGGLPQATPARKMSIGAAQ
jgi:hypothetical protein